MTPHAPRPIAGISIVIPVFDEEDNVLPLAEEIARAMRSLALPWEAIFVDDGSRDATAARLKEAAQRAPEVRWIALPQNRGQSAATLAGVRAARQSHVATLDGDLQNDPADLRLLLERAAEHDVVIGRRRERRDSLGRRIGSRLANAVRRAALRDGSTDTGCSLKLFPRDAFLDLPAFDGMHRFLPALFRAQGLDVFEVEVGHRPRRSGRSKYGNLARLGRGILDLAGVAWLTRRTLKR